MNLLQTDKIITKKQNTIEPCLNFTEYTVKKKLQSVANAVSSFIVSQQC